MYDVGDKVWLHCPAVPKGHCRKFHWPWQGSFTIVKVIDSTVYCIQCNMSPHKRLVVEAAQFQYRMNQSTPLLRITNKMIILINRTKILCQILHLRLHNQQYTNRIYHPLSQLPQTQTHPFDDQAGDDSLQTDMEQFVSYPDCYSSDSDT